MKRYVDHHLLIVSLFFFQISFHHISSRTSEEENQTMVQNNPTPFDVGRAFVHQYYTLLHRAPGLLHRFYSTDSTFIHGGVDRPGSIEQPAVGPLNISKRIQELDLQDCHAKIRQVDSHPTIGSGVVVQVTGELSNNGNRMRRFMQTFVLAPREPKKYYVQNDIFRYQDEVFDEQSDEDDRSSSQVYNDTDKVSNADSSAAPVQPPQQQQPQPPVVEVQHQALPPRRAPEPQQVVEPVVNMPSEVTTTMVDSTSSINQPAKSANVEGHSYAGIAKLTATSGTTPVVAAAVSAPPTNPTPVVPTVTPPSTVKSAPIGRGYPSQRGTNDGSYRSNYRSNHWSNEQQTDGNFRPSNSSNNQLTAPNEQQVFVGSLTANMTREDLIDCFSSYGTVIDAKIITFPDYKKNYGFVAFDDVETATGVHQLQHVMYKDHKLNVEPKTQKHFGNQHNAMGNLRHNYSNRGAVRGMNRGGGYRNAPGANQRRGGGGGYRYENPEENHPKVPSQS